MLLWHLFHFIRAWWIFQADLVLIKMGLYWPNFSLVFLIHLFLYARAYCIWFSWRGTLAVMLSWRKMGIGKKNYHLIEFSGKPDMLIMSALFQSKAEGCVFKLFGKQTVTENKWLYHLNEKQLLISCEFKTPSWKINRFLCLQVLIATF